MFDRLKPLLKNTLERAGYRLSRIPREEQIYKFGGYDEASPLPDGAEERLARNHPRLLELRERYQRFDSPVVKHSMWDDSYRSVDLDLRYFRGDNIYVWQMRNLREQARLKYFIYASYLNSFDTRGLIRKLGEDGSFGCFSFEFEGYGRVSRDLLDSVNELYFLDRHLGLFERQDLRVLDIGAGYGRMAYRMINAVPGLSKYWCTDAVPESTFLCEYYLEHRGVLGKAQVIPADETLQLPPRGQIDLALNIHSFSEMNLAAISAWFDWLVQLDVKHLLIVPNEADQLLSYEADGTRIPFGPVLSARGFRLKAQEPIYRDADVVSLIGVPDQFLLFERA